MSHRIIQIFLFSFLFVFTRAQHPGWQQQVNYNIDVTLNDKENTLIGFQKIEYINNSPDTLYFIWFHIWPNAYKNENTVLSDQLISKGNTRLYFARENEKGYINRLNFEINGETALIEDHPAHIDIVRLLLPEPLAPGKSVVIQSSFHVKLPAMIAGAGHHNHRYVVSNWFPRPAVYDQKGWQPAPLQVQGGAYHEFGEFNVTIHAPADYAIVAPGILIKTEDSSSTYHLKYATDFTWYAANQLKLTQDSLQLSDGRTLTIRIWQDITKHSLKTIASTNRKFTQPKNKITDNNLSFEVFRNELKRILKKVDEWVGPYPYSTLDIVDTPKLVTDFYFPMISFFPVSNYQHQSFGNELSMSLLRHWFASGVMPDLTRHPWMKEGFTSYYAKRLESCSTNCGIKPLLQSIWLHQLERLGMSRPSGLSADQYNALEYNLMTGTKTAAWLSTFESEQEVDKIVRNYLNLFRFKHVYPEDFKLILRDAGKDTGSLFSLLNHKHVFRSRFNTAPKKVQITGWPKFKNTDSVHYISVTPAFGYNHYDGLMIGAAVHNYQLPLPALKFLAIPMYGIKSKTADGIGRLSYYWNTNGIFSRVQAGIAAAKFSMDEYSNDDTQLNFSFQKFAPFLRFTVREKSNLSTTERTLQLKSYFIKENELRFNQVVDNGDTSYVPGSATADRQLNQLKYQVYNNRTLYPYRYEFLAEQGKNFIRTAFTGNYFFNYSSEGGVSARFFAGKFFYTTTKTFATQFATNRYHLNMTGANGYEDYTYSNYFIGRNEFEKFASQQIVMRDGGFKVRTDLLSNKVGKTDNWLIALNLETTIPSNLNPLELLPVKIPVRLFLDIGTYAEAWDASNSDGKLLFDAGIRMPLLKEMVNIYIPVVYSKVYSNYFKSTIPEKRFWKTISFSIDINRINEKSRYKSLPL